MPNLAELSLAGSFIGGIGLFLLGMNMMTDGLKMAAGEALKRILSEWTRTPLRGFLSGVMITSLVQSSSAVTVAVIGFVNAGLLDILKTVYVIYGTNIGTTMTSWLVAIVGFKLHVQALALPLIGAGMFLRVISGNTRRGALGEAVAGFGLFFLGIAVLKDAFADIGNSISFSGFDQDALGLLVFTGLGFILTFLMQSSSAAMAVTLTAAAGGLIPMEEAAAMVIGANVGTTSTAALAVIGATANAQRIAAAHVLFNLITGTIALLILAPMLSLIEQMRQMLGMAPSMLTSLALFHTLFNIFGVLLLWSFTPALVEWLKQRMRSAEEDLGRPVYLDMNVVTTPALAFNALVMELGRMGDFAGNMLRDAFSTERHTSVQLHKDQAILERLAGAVDHFSIQMQKANLPGEISEKLPLALRISRYYQEAAAVAVQMSQAQENLPYLDDAELQASLDHFRSDCVKLLELSDPLCEAFAPEKALESLDELEKEYARLKAQLLNAGAKETIRLRQMVAQLDLFSGVRRAMEQTVKGASYFSSLQQLVQDLGEKREEQENLTD